MTHAEKYYPEFDSTEVEETISPLAEFDEELAAALRNSPEIPECPDLRVEAGGPVAEWVNHQEGYPFQRLVRIIASAVAGMDPLAGCAELFQDSRAALIEVLQRTESRVRALLTRPLVVAVNHAREHGLLLGDSPRQRYEYFVEQSGRTSFEQVSGLSFPVLRDVVRIVLHNESQAVREMCLRIAADRAAIAACFGIDTTEPIVACGFSEGDSHNHGRSVSVLEFESGRKLVYKPRDVSCEAAYETIAAELNDRFRTNLAAARVLDRDGYGYVEYIETADVSDMSAEFMYACGELAGTLYLLNARDMHFENVRPTRRGPVPVDLETILHPARVHTGPTPEAPGNAYDTIAQSVYGIGILPLVMVGKGDATGHVDLGFLGDKGQGDSPFKTIQFEEPFTDRMRLALRPQAAQERQTVVNTVSEEDVQFLGERMAAGFTHVFRAALSDRAGCGALLHKATRDARVRYVHNPTALYAQTLRMTSGANAADDLDALLALLKRVAIASKTSARNIVRSEMRQLLERDIPYFTVASTGVELTDGNGVAVGASFEESPLDRAQAKIANLTEFDLGEQLKLIHSAFSSRFPDNHLAAVDDGERQATSTAPKHHDRFPSHARQESQQSPLAELAEELGRTLVATSVPDRFAHLPRTWIGPLASAQANRPWPPGVLGYDLYTGRVGPALALAAAGRVLDNREFRDLAEQIFSSTADILSSHRYEIRSIRQAGFAGYTGLAGILFALAAAGKLLHEQDWVHAAQSAVPLVLEEVRAGRDAEPHLDVIGGIAGVISCFTTIGGPHAADAVSTLTSMLTEGVVAAQVLRSQSGFAHGISGVIHTLSRACPDLPEGQREVVREILSDLVEQLHTFYDTDAANWYSNKSTPRSFSTGWCHGAAGISLALSAYAELSGDADAARMRDIAVDNTLRYGFGRNLTWCHGDLGNHDILSGIAASSENEPLRREVRSVERNWLHPEMFRRKRADHRSRYAHTNSLMVGSAGMLLHLANRIDPRMHTSPVTLTMVSE